MECKYCEKNNNCAIQKSFTEEEIGCSKGVLTIKAQKELNAFQIIKEKEVSIDVFYACICPTTSYEIYKKYWRNIMNGLSREELTKREFELLKEALL